ncbi:MAG: nucleotidyltransferase family protein [Acidobacteria bacterium]|nr:nucleotidyltransferase family protein [Acidobacteriota bacterium]
MGMAPVNKVVIMARGLGTRMRKSDESAVLDNKQTEVAGLGVKAMIPIDRPFLDYVLSELANAGYSEVCLVIGPEHTMIRDYYLVESPPERIRISFAIQEKPLGTADAVAAAKEFTGQDHFLVINSDNYYPVDALGALRKLRGPGVALFDRDSLVAGSNVPQERILKFAVVKIDGDGYLERIFEKPSEDTIRELGDPVYVSMNSWVFSPDIYRACSNIQPSQRGELELSDAIQYAIEELKVKFKVLTFQAPVLDLSSRSDIAAVTEKLRGTQPNP